MTDLQGRRDLFIRNRDTMQSTFSWDSSTMQMCCAYLFTVVGKTAEKDSLKQTKKLLESRVGAFSQFNSTLQHLLIALLDRSDDPEGLLDRAMQLYDPLKRELYSSTYLPLAAMLLAEHAERGRYDELVTRTGRIWERMRHDHPWMSDAMDFAPCAVMAMSGQTDDALFERIDRSFGRLKGPLGIFSNSQIYALSQVMALMPGDTEAKCRRVLELSDAMKKQMNRWSTGHEIPVLGILANDPRPVEELASAVADNNRWFDTQKGFGFFSFISTMQRFLYASLLTQEQTDDPLTAILNEQAAVQAAMGTTIEDSRHHHHHTSYH